ncbi:MAG: hypothetical protein FH748_02630 [Balneolaceae bacterium]|nr:hypothetical protein [Balneolaceae bacterium]
MSFLNPIFLFALLAVGLPLLIHLLNLRKPQKIDFSTLAFFQELKKTTIKRIRIKKYLLLFLRLLAIACLAMVLARPFLPPGLIAGSNSQAPSLNAILLDNSISMSRIGTQGPLLDYGKDIIREIEKASKDGDRFILQNTNGEAEYGGILSHSNLLNSLEEIEVSKSGNYTSQRLNGLIERVKESPYENKKIFIVTDGQQSQFSRMEEAGHENIAFTVIDAGEIGVQNTHVEQVATSTNMIGTNIPFLINVTVSNKGEVPAINQFVSLEFKGEPAGQYSVSLAAGESETYTFEVSPSSTGSSQGRVLIEGDEFQADNTYYFTVQVPETRQILWIKEDKVTQDFISYTGAVLQVAGENDAQLNVTEASPGASGNADLSAYNAIILDGVEEIPEYLFQPIQDFIQSGNGLLFFPSENGNIANYNDFIARFNAGRYVGLKGEYASFNAIASADELLEDHPAFSGLFEREENEDLTFTNPEIYYYLKLQTNDNGSGYDLLELNNGDVLVHEKKFGEGSLVLSAIGNDPGWSDFPVKPLFAPFYYRTLLFAASSDEGGFANHTLGRTFSWTGDIESDQAVLVKEVAQIKPNVNVVTNGIELSYPAEEWLPGWVTVTDGDKEVIVSVNMENTESGFAEMTEENFETTFPNTNVALVDAANVGDEELEREIQASGFGQEIWHWFMLAGLLLLVTESMISIWYKAETVS